MMTRSIPMMPDVGVVAYDGDHRFFARLSFGISRRD